MKPVDRLSQRFGRLVVISKAKGHKRTHWHCKCDCGTERVVSNSNLASGNTTSCGCVWAEKVRGNMIGVRFGKLVVTELSEEHRAGASVFAKYRCRCDCGGEIVTFGMSLRNGDTTSCGCAYADAGFLRRKTDIEKIATARRCNRRRAAAKRQAYRPFNRELFDLVEVEVYQLAMLRSQATGVPHEVDHTVPLKSPLVCGLHSEFNLRVITASQNRSKRNYYWPDMPAKEI